MKRTVISVIVLSLLCFIAYKVNEPTVTIAHGSLTMRYTDNKAAKEAKYIVIGTVKKHIGFSNEAFPMTDMTVEIEKSIKGNLNGEIVFVQEGGFDKEENRIIQIDNYKLLKEGNKYLLFLNEVPDEPGKYWSIGGPQTVYGLEKGKAINAHRDADNKTLAELEDIINNNK
ncbi:hypothetical protein GTO89_05090 [Heliobacterium gestii]|uniref:Lipoprotein n=1 Tax=Heliomicrobium gestii TaxID=2699 RepID=A0A845LD64_HELGE|nr:hypothetical protein [Heliomicrobium gestii]MBM7868528.1 hypothetical protein [Heliomicrobium gestii]MZP42415.1 hypothetical protein [Heliomicrobium gestii]